MPAVAPSFWDSVLVTAKTVEIDSSADAFLTYTPQTGRRFACFHLYLQAEAAGDVQAKSGSTDISGPINIANANDILDIKNFGIPVLLGRATGEAMTLNQTPAAGIQFNGFAVIAEFSGNLTT